MTHTHETLEGVTRVELVEISGGRVFVQYGAKVTLSFQDDGHTLKIFVEPRGRRYERHPLVEEKRKEVKDAVSA